MNVANAHAGRCATGVWDVEPGDNPNGKEQTARLDDVEQSQDDREESKGTIARRTSAACASR